ncbi:MAG TPA: TonB family protein [Burkholderiaceae bacterium]|nr:TonB family protein [Burkholderiaceae bacterium]
MPLTLVILMHVGFFYALQAGLLQPPIHQLVPNEVLVRFITAEPAAQPAPAPQPAPTPAPKTVPILKKPLPKPVVKTPPAVKPAPAEQAITQPAPEPQPAQPAAASAPPATPATAPAAAASAPAAVAAAPKTISSGVEYLQAPQPEYPLLARRKGEEGKVVLRALINLKGRPEGVEIQTSSGSPRLDEAARQAVLRAVFKPHLENGQAVMVYAIVPIKFQLDR